LPENVRWILVSTTLMVALATACSPNKPVEIAVRGWARATPPGATVGAVYLTIENPGSGDRLREVRTTSSERAEIHETTMDDDRMQMRAIDVLEIPAGGTVKFEPGGLHLMLIGLKEPMQTGHSIELTLVFEHGGSKQVQVRIEPIGALAPEEGDSAHAAHH
jgi:periplasmic copper chaperone A